MLACCRSSAHSRELDGEGEVFQTPGITLSKPTILVFIEYYLPGYKAGGPIRAVENVTARLAGDAHFRIVTSDRDLGDLNPYPDVRPNRWTRLSDEADVLYLPPESQTWRNIGRLCASVPHDVVYLNSAFSLRFSLLPLLLRRGARLSCPVIVAPRGEFAPSALRHKRAKKRAFLALARATGLYRDVTWHAGSAREQDDIEAIMGEQARICVAPHIPAPADPMPRANVRKAPGELSVAFLSRISPIKNLDAALRIMGRVRHCVTFDIYGPIEDTRYWHACVELIKRLPPNVRATYRGTVEHSEVRRTLAPYDLFFLPSHGESFSYAIAEALSAGCPVLTSSQTPWRDLEEHGAGWALPLEDEARFLAIVEHLASSDGAALAGLRERASAYYAQRSCSIKTIELWRTMFAAAA